MKKTKKRAVLLQLCIICVLILSCSISYFCVWTYDDLVTNTGGIASLIEESLFYGNGRYFGNFFVNLCLPRKMLDMFFGHLRIILTAFVPMFPVWTVLSYGIFRTLRSYTGSSRLLLKFRPLFYAILFVQPLSSLVAFCTSETRFKERIPLTNIHIENMTEKIHCLFSVFLVVYLFCVVLVLIRDEQVRGNRLFYVGMLCLFAASLGELLIVTVMGSRCLFLPVCILILLLISFIEQERLLHQKLAALSCSGGIAAMLFLLVIMHTVSKVNAVKMEYAWQQLAEGKTVVELIRLPHRKWLCEPDESWTNGYLFHTGEIRAEDDFVFITYDEYLARQEKRK